MRSESEFRVMMGHVHGLPLGLLNHRPIWCGVR